MITLHKKFTARLAALQLVLLSQASIADSANMGVEDNYFLDSAGEPVFLLGYYNWASPVDGAYIDHPTRFQTLIDNAVRYGLNYVRVSLGVNRFTAKTTPASWNRGDMPIPFLYENDKADLDRWDPEFWDGLRAALSAAREKGVYVHLSLFDNVNLSGGNVKQNYDDAYRWNNSPWNIRNQVRDFFGDIDRGAYGANEDGEFYDTRNFLDGDGENRRSTLGDYQKRYIDKVLAETAEFENVFYEIGNELKAKTAWQSAVLDYVKTRTAKPVTLNNHVTRDLAGRVATLPEGLDGFAVHKADTAAQLKETVDYMKTRGPRVPAWDDPDGPALGEADATESRQAAWYAFTGGAAMWAGFSFDYFSDGGGFDPTKASYYQNLGGFIRHNALALGEMMPRHDLVSNGKVNSLLAVPGQQYVAYILNDANASVDLSATGGSFSAVRFDPVSADYSAAQTLAGGRRHVFAKPAGATDWVILIRRLDAASDQAPQGTIDTPATDITLREGESVRFTASGSDPRDTALRYAWDFGVAGGSALEDPDEVMFANAGTYTVTLNVTNAAGVSDPTPATRTITVLPAGNDSVLLSPNRPMRASSVEDASLHAGNAADGDRSTRWASREGSDGEWIWVDLGAPAAIDRVVLDWERAYAQAYTLQVSDDGANWRTVYRESAGDGDRDEVPVAATGRYVRMLGEQRATQWGYSLWEFEVYGR